MRRFEDYYSFATKMVVQKGEFIFTSKDDRHAYFLHSGICALCSAGKNKEVKTHLYFMDQRLIGFAHFARNVLSLHDSLPQNPLTVLAKTDCIVYRIDGETVMNLMRTDLYFSNLLFEILSENYLNIFHRYLQMEEENAPVRVCMLCMDYAIEDQGVLQLPRFFTSTEIAEYLNIHPVTLSRIMGTLKQLGCVKKEGHHIQILDPKVMEQIIHKEIEISY